ncbi:MAG: hypothetical protein FJ119_01530 [Deltaproteobacteria bacterium]|nr:hypothetical protein [Deltaproteobacteria bacterium]
MLPHPPAVVKCRHCGECYWLDDAKEVGTVDWGPDGNEPTNTEWADAQMVKEPTEKQYYQAIKKGLAKDKGQEVELRVFAFWRRNDAFRKASRKKKISSEPGLWSTNLEILASLLTEKNDDHRMMKGEVLRHLGRFDEAKQVLGSVESPDYASAVQQIIALCDSRDRCVRELAFSD